MQENPFEYHGPLSQLEYDLEESIDDVMIRIARANAVGRMHAGIINTFLNRFKMPKSKKPSKWAIMAAEMEDVYVDRRKNHVLRQYYDQIKNKVVYHMLPKTVEMLIKDEEDVA